MFFARIITRNWFRKYIKTNINSEIFYYGEYVRIKIRFNKANKTTKLNNWKVTQVKNWTLWLSPVWQTSNSYWLHCFSSHKSGSQTFILSRKRFRSPRIKSNKGTEILNVNLLFDLAKTMDLIWLMRYSNNCGLFASWGSSLPVSYTHLTLPTMAVV